jgi:hypothetical protein
MRVVHHAGLRVLTPGNVFATPPYHGVIIAINSSVDYSIINRFVYNKFTTPFSILKTSQHPNDLIIY